MPIRPAGRRTCEEFFGRPATEVAPELLGSIVSCGGVSVRLTEVEAYAGLADPASHAFRGATARTAVMFGPPGHVYVYFVYGVHWAVNLVCERDGTAAACLLRGGELVEGEEQARQRRGDSVDRHRLACGPGNLASALGVDGAMSGSSLWEGPITWSGRARGEGARQIETGPRVGVAAAAEQPWRFWLAGEPSVSTYRRHVPRRRSPAQPPARRLEGDVG